MKKTIVVLVSLLVLAMLMISACAPAAPEKVVETVVVEKEVEKVVEKTVVVEVEKEAEKTVDEMAVAKEFLKGKKICAILPGPVNDGGWNGAAYGGLTNLRDNFGMDMAYRERTKPEEAADLMRQYAESGCDIIQAHGSEFMDQINAVALEYPDVQFMQLSRCTGQEPNLIGLCYSTGQGGYVIGRLASWITKTGKVAFVVGTKYPNMDWQPHMAQVAAKDLKAEGKISLDVVVEEKEVGSWDDPAKAKEVTSALLEQDYDVIVGIADAGDIGSIEAVKEAYEKGKKVWFISWVTDRNYLGPDFILGGWTEDAAMQVQYAAIQYALHGAPIGKGFPLGVDVGVAYPNPTYGLVSQDIDKDVYATFVKVRDDPKSIPNLVVRDDL